MTRVLLTGASGFIGRHCLRPLGALPFEVHAVSSRARPAAAGVAEWHQADLLVPGAGARLIETVRPTHLLHLAWCATPGEFWTSPQNLSWVQVSIELLRAFADQGGERFVGAGSCAEYAVAADDCDERTTRLRPGTLYGSAKHAFHAVLEGFARGRLSASWGRVFHLYGPLEHPDRLVPSVILALLAGREAQCSAGTQVRDFLHVQDVADAFAAILASDVEGPVNIASGSPAAVADVVRRIGQLLQAESLIRLGARPPPPHDPPRLTADVTRIRDEVGWHPAVSLDRGLAETIEWWRTERGREA
ncbi:MAG: NAD(P)-dependent oxidoreductase [Acidobacteriota bacterium]